MTKKLMTKWRMKSLKNWGRIINIGGCLMKNLDPTYAKFDLSIYIYVSEINKNIIPRTNQIIIDESKYQLIID